MPEIMRLANEHGLYVIEDCAQSHAAALSGRMAGSFGHFAAFSFCQDKIMTTGGEGGMLVTDDSGLWEKAWSYKDHGKDRQATETEAAGGSFKWLHHQFGTNWRMTEFQAAIGIIQLEKLPVWSSIRRQHAASLAAGLAGIRGLRVPVAPSGIVHAYYKFYAFLQPEQLKPGWNQKKVVEAIRAEGIPCGVGSCSEIYREKAFLDAGLSRQIPTPVAHELGQTSMMFMVHPTLQKQDIDDTCGAIGKVMTAASI
jgi:dTDP-4-amino-4,6-dideoxygalactose transaminase